MQNSDLSENVNHMRHCFELPRLGLHMNILPLTILIQAQPHWGDIVVSDDIEKPAKRVLCRRRAWDRI